MTYPNSLASSLGIWRAGVWSLVWGREAIKSSTSYAMRRNNEIPTIQTFYFWLLCMAKSFSSLPIAGEISIENKNLIWTCPLLHLGIVCYAIPILIRRVVIFAYLVRCLEVRCVDLCSVSFPNDFPVVGGDQSQCMHWNVIRCTREIRGSHSCIDGWIRADNTWIRFESMKT